MERYYSPWWSISKRWRGEGHTQEIHLLNGEVTTLESPYLEDLQVFFRRHAHEIDYIRVRSSLTDWLEPYPKKL